MTAFDCLHHGLLIAKLGAYSFDIKSVKLIKIIRSNRKKRVKVGNAYSSWKETFYRIPQGSIPGPFIFNIFLCDLFYFLEGVTVEPVTLMIPHLIVLTKQVIY